MSEFLQSAHYTFFIRSVIIILNVYIKQEVIRFMKTIFSQNLSAIRRELGISQKEAAAALGVSQALMSHYETGTREPGLDFVVRAAEYYHISTDILLRRPINDMVSLVSMRSRLSMPHTQSDYGKLREHMSEELLAFLLDQLNLVGNNDMTASALNYVEDAIYELLRHVARLYDGYDPMELSKLDPGLESSVMSDMSIMRVRYVAACMAYHNSAESKCLPPANMTPDEARRSRYGDFTGMIDELLTRIHKRIASGTPDTCPIPLFQPDPSDARPEGGAL